MMSLYTVLFGLLAYTHAQPGNVGSIDVGQVKARVQIGNMSEPTSVLMDQDVIATNNAIHLIEWSRTVFKNGFGPLPPMDPYKNANIPDMVINFPDALISGRIGLSNLVLMGSKDFVLDNLTVYVATERCDYHFHVPEYSAEVAFDAHITIDEANYDLKGIVRLDAVNVHIDGASQGVIVEDMFQQEGIVLNIQADDVKVGLLNSRRRIPMMGAVSNDIVDVIANAAAKVIAQAAIDQTNDILSHFTVGQLMALLLPN